LSTKKIVAFVEEKRKASSQNLQDWLKKNEITRETYQECSLYNEQLSHVLKMTFIKGETLVEKKILDRPSALWDYEKKPRDEKEAFEIMKRLILEGSENPYIRKFALNIAERCSQNIGIPVAVPPVEELYSEALVKEEIKNANAFINHCEKVARDIYEFVRARMVYVSDPPDDYYQKAYHTLEILDLKGDCDDFAILLCSLLRSIGYRTFLGFQPHHVFAGIILARSSSSATEEGNFEYVEVPLDPQLEDFEIKLGSQKMLFNVFDILNGDFLSLLTRIAKDQIGSISEEDVKRATDEIESILKRLSQFSYAHIFFIDQPIPTIKIVATLKSELSRFISLVRR